MRILTLEVSNFGSYKTLDFDFTEDQARGLTLIQGPTGSGKSTFCDAVTWILFGKTAKGGTVDEVRSWNQSEPTMGSLLLATPTGPLSIGRSRGKGNNDLYFEHADGMGNPIRGKDLLDTQRLLSGVLGFDYETYLAAGYYHEFSQTANFFTTTAKNRRQICEQLVDLTMAVKLQVATKETIKTLETVKDDVDRTIYRLRDSVATLKRFEQSESRKHNEWEENKKDRLNSLIKQYEDFESARTKTISKVCHHCKTVLQAPKEVTDSSPNPFSDRLLDVEQSQNPHSDIVKDFSQEIHSKTDELVLLNIECDDLKKTLADHEELSSIIDHFRSASILNTIKYVESQTNQLLSDYFDAEIRVGFDVEAADKIDVTIYKDGNVAAFTQLSKGQRQLLKLCFGISVMKTIQNHHGISLKQLYFDEATDGLDEKMKLKALKMLETLTLSYDTVFLVEHSEALKTMVTNSYQVRLVNGESQFESI